MYDGELSGDQSMPTGFFLFHIFNNQIHCERKFLKKMKNVHSRKFQSLLQKIFVLIIICFCVFFFFLFLEISFIIEVTLFEDYSGLPDCGFFNSNSYHNFTTLVFEL